VPGMRQGTAVTAKRPRATEDSSLFPVLPISRGSARVAMALCALDDALVIERQGTRWTDAEVQRIRAKCEWAQRALEGMK
jgi:hypothetical protein